MKYYNKLFFLFFCFLFFFQKVFSLELKFANLKNLTFDDLQTITSIDLNRNNLTEIDLNTIIKELYESKLIYDVSYEINKKNVLINIEETKKIKSIYINGSLGIDKEQILNFINSKDGDLFDNDQINLDIKNIRNLYLARGYDNISITLTSENISDGMINLIFNIFEGKQSKISKINFYGNNYFSNRYLKNVIKSEDKGMISIFSSGSNLNRELFNFDKSLILNEYNKNGFFNANVTYELSLDFLNNYNLEFFITENERVIISEIDFQYSSLNLENIFDNQISDLKKKINDDIFYFDQNKINQYLNKLNLILEKNSINDSYFAFNIEKKNEFFLLTIKEIKLDPIIINKIVINGNSITKDKTLRSRIGFEPGDYLNEYVLSDSENKLKKLKYINDVKITKQITNNQSDIFVNLDENKKTGMFLLSGSFSGDTGVGGTFTIKDTNLFGTGNELNSSLSFNAENVLFDINYTSLPLNKPLLTNYYSIFNNETDLINSFGYKMKKQGLSYKLKYSYSKNTSISSGLEFLNSKGYSAKNTNTYINDNIGEFQDIAFDFSINYDTTDNFLYPTKGFNNKLRFKLSPEELSDNAFLKLSLHNDNYFKNKLNESFFFLSNNIGYADSFDGNLKTSNAFSLGGLNFRGFDYRGVGPFDDNTYLGGNKYFTSTIGYGSSFIFDKSDNINFKLFATTGSIWDSDYSNDDEFDLRSSYGISFDIFTDVMPVTFSYAIPIDKKNSDKVRYFNFSLGTSF